MAGPLLLRWAAALGPLHSITPIVFPALRDLAQQTGETIGLAEYEPATRTARMASVVPGSKPIHYDLPTGSDVPLAAGAAGKAILAFLPDDTLSGLPLVTYTDRTPLHRTTIRKDLAQVRDRGWPSATVNASRTATASPCRTSPSTPWPAPTRPPSRATGPMRSTSTQ
ncbi:IclR family transcriptional regulator domain-containing protein [Streptomyces sp. WG5]|uniref:IclR family transcriptional regulator domain-containing protein n=1 Tax=Streptomyces sp. WG5 TaxID=3417648 RepID=UPI003CE7CABF